MSGEKGFKRFTDIGVKSCGVWGLKDKVEDALPRGVCGNRAASTTQYGLDAPLIFVVTANRKERRMGTENKVVLFVLYRLGMKRLHLHFRLFKKYDSPLMNGHNRKNAFSRLSENVGCAKMVSFAVAASISPAIAIATVAMSSSAYGENISPPMMNPSPSA